MFLDKNEVSPFQKSPWNALCKNGLFVKNTHFFKTKFKDNRPLAGYGLPTPPRGNFVDHIFLEAQCLARILQHVSPLTMAALSCNSLLHTLPYKIFDN